MKITEEVCRHNIKQCISRILVDQHLTPASFDLHHWKWLLGVAPVGPCDQMVETCEHFGHYSTSFVHILMCMYVICGSFYHINIRCGFLYHTNQNQRYRSDVKNSRNPQPRIKHISRSLQHGTHGTETLSSLLFDVVCIFYPQPLRTGTTLQHRRIGQPR